MLTASNTPGVNGLYVNKFIDTSNSLTTILGVPANENALLQFCINNRINYITLYTLQNMNWNSPTSVSLSSPGTNLLASFIQKAKSSGITSVGAARQSDSDSLDEIIAFNVAQTASTRMFDVFTIEHEWWNGEITFSGFKSNLIYLYNTGHAAAHPLSIELYIGWPNSGEMVQLVPYLDRLLIHDYRTHPDYGYTRNRLLDISAGLATIPKVLDTMPIFSSEPGFMGPYYASNTIYDAYYDYAVPSINTTYGSYNNESNSNIRTYINIVGSMMFDFTLFRDVNPPAPPISCTSSIFALGPTTFNSGSSVVLTATTGTTYIWSPSGQTGSTITATTSGTYYCTVTNGTGCTAASNQITVNVLTVTGFTAFIQASGPLFFQLPNNVILSASTIPSSAATTYRWYPLTLTSSATTASYTAITSGNFYCVVTNSSGVTAQTETVTVNAQYVPPSGNYTEAVFGSALAYTSSDTSFPWFPIALHLTETTKNRYYIFVKMKSRNGAPTGLRVSVDGTRDFVPITNVRDTVYKWYRIGSLNGAIMQTLTDPTVNYIYFQALNNSFDMQKLAISTNPNYVPGPYPTTSP